MKYLLAQYQYHNIPNNHIPLYTLEKYIHITVYNHIVYKHYSELQILFFNIFNQPIK